MPSSIERLIGPLQAASRNFGNKTASIVGAKSYGRNHSKLGITHYDEYNRKKPSFCVMYFHMYNVKKLMVPLVFVAIVKLSLKAMLILPHFHFNLYSSHTLILSYSHKRFSECLYVHTLRTFLQTGPCTKKF
jgi:hypothetical protein